MSDTQTEPTASDAINKRFEEVTEQLVKTVEEMRDDHSAAIAKGKEQSEEVVKRIDSHQKNIDELLTKQKELADKLDTLKRGGASDEDGNAIATKKERNEALRAFVKDKNPDLLKSMNTLTGDEGGLWVPSVMSDKIIEALVEISPIRQYANVETIENGGSFEIMDEGGIPQTAWGNELGSLSETTGTPTGLLKIAVHDLHAYPSVSAKLLRQVNFDLEAWLVKRISAALAKGEGTAFTNGGGVDRPKGYMNGLTSADSRVLAMGSTTVMDMNKILTMKYDLPTDYAPNAAFYMNRKITGQVRILQDDQGQYLWQPSMQIGQPPTLDGDPVVEVPDMPSAIASDAIVVAYGDMREAYTIVDAEGMPFKRDDVTDPRFVKLYVEKNVGGKVVNEDALRFVQMRTS